jgi:hypothetical protein
MLVLPMPSTVTRILGIHWQTLLYAMLPRLSLWSLCLFPSRVHHFFIFLSTRSKLFVTAWLIVGFLFQLGFNFTQFCLSLR